MGNRAQEQGRDASRTAPELDLFTGRDVVSSRPEVNEPESASEKDFTDDLNDREIKEIAGGPNKTASPVKRRSARNRSFLFILIILGASVILALGYFHLKHNILSLNNKEIESVPEKRRFPILKEETITFDSFVVPFRENKRFTYISLSIVFRLPNKEIGREMSRKRDYIRGILYDMFTEEINRSNKIPPIDHLKEIILRTVNQALSTGMVREVFITQFLAV